MYNSKTNLAILKVNKHNNVSVHFNSVGICKLHFKYINNHLKVIIKKLWLILRKQQKVKNTAFNRYCVKLVYYKNNLLDFSNTKISRT